MITGYTTSKDYARLAEVMKARTVVCVVTEVNTSVAYSQKDRAGDDVFLVSAAGNLLIHTESLEEFATECERYGVEWIVPDDLRDPVKTVDEVLNEVAKDLPRNWSLVLTSENRLAGVTLTNPRGYIWDMDDGIHTISEQINNAVALAKAEENRPGGVPEIYRCLSCGKNAPEHGMICDECRMDSMND
jgi:hypothetical protein